MKNDLCIFSKQFLLKTFTKKSEFFTSPDLLLQKSKKDLALQLLTPICYICIYRQQPTVWIHNNSHGCRDRNKREKNLKIYFEKKLTLKDRRTLWRKRHEKYGLKGSERLPLSKPNLLLTVFRLLQTITARR